MNINPFFNSLSSLPLLSNARSRSINAENIRGEKGKGGTTSSNLGRSRKGSPCINALQPGSTTTLAEINGSGVINHIWITVTEKTSEQNCFVLRDLILRIFWDDEETPSVESPLGDFFCCGFAKGCLVDSLPISVNPNRGFNSFFPMPFRRKAKITIENQHEVAVPAFFYQVDYCLYDKLPNETAYFHAQWRRQRLTKLANDYVIVDDIKGKGHYVGTYLALTTLERYWWGEGEVKFYIDGDVEYPTICSTGTEDYFGGAWSFADQIHGKTVEKTYSTPFMGYPFYSAHDNLVYSPYFNDDCPPMRGFYRWHIMDPIHFEEDLKVTIQQIGVSHRGLFERQDDVASVAYWYQSEPHQSFSAILDKEKRWPR